MGMTLTEKILAAHSGKDAVAPGELVNCKIDFCLGNDITAPIAIEEFKKLGVAHVFNKNRIALVPDHFTPNKDIKSAQQSKILREFAAKYKIKNYFEIGRCGVEHALLPEKGLILPGYLVIGADSHTCTYGALNTFSTGVGSTDLAAAMATGEVWLKIPESIKIIYNGSLNEWVTGKDLILYTIGKIGVDGARYMSIEFTGETIKNLSMDSRLAMANMAIEAGAKNGIFEFDEKTGDFVSTATMNIEDEPVSYKPYKADEDAVYNKSIEYDASQIELQVAFPHLPSNSKGLSEIKEDIIIDQVVIGSCTNGRIEDLRIAAGILKGKKIAKNVRCIIIPATQKIYKQAVDEGLFDIFIDAEAAISTPTCGPCLGGHMGILAEGEKCVATTNRNFVGRMGHVKSEIYLSGPAVAAASAILGKIGGPDQII